MSQATNWGLLTAAPATRIEQTNRINAADNALMTQHSGASRPPYLTAGLWRKEVSSTIEELYHFDGTHDILIGTLNPTTGAWISAGQGDKVIAVTSDLTLTSAHNNALLVVDATIAAVTLTLTPLATLGEPFNFRVKKEDSSANTVTVSPTSPDTMNGGTDDLVLSTQNDSVAVSADIDTSPDNWVSINISGGSAQAAYPVGSIYMNASNSANPNAIFGFGTWAALAPGRVLIGAGTGTDVNSIERTFSAEGFGGEYIHTLSVNEIPGHKHKNGINSGSGIFVYNFTTDGIPGTSNAQVTQAGGSGGYQGYTETVGGGAAHTNIQPYLTVYMWVRTA